ncbi:MAG: HipA domain-containing protein [Polyangiaceae bacterium]|jgi:serine/threonine-protein kinase HipA|nr:HipA domain-containing protein [Polyangiaceae bacterium]
MTSPRLKVLIGRTRVGELVLEHGDRTQFRFDSAYLELPDRPVLGRWFEDRLGRDFVDTGVHSKVPNFFRHVLPDPTSVLRRLLSQKANVKSHREFFLLAALGEDLPGALRVLPDGALEDEDGESFPASEAAQASRLKFSLAGMQLKFSAREEGQRLTLPMRGEEARFLVKMPDPRFAQLPRNECATLDWARLAGLDVPDHCLVPIDQLDGLPEELSPAEPWALRVTRYDRTEKGRVHQEDFALVLGKPHETPDDKYESRMEVVSAIVHALCPEDFPEFLRRVAFVVLSGNADAHLKNWSLVYPEGKRPRLSPAYDLVCTLYAGTDRDLALPIHKKYPLESIDEGDVVGLATRVGYDEARARSVVGDFVAKARAAFADVRGEFPPDVLTRLEEHLARLRL